MYEIRKNDVVIAYADTPVWVKRLDNGDFGLTDRKHAEGLTINGTVYSLGGLDGYEQVVANEIDGAALLYNQFVEIGNLETAMCEADMANAEWQAEVETALCELDGGE